VSLDVKYRPRWFGDVLGQKSAITILRQTLTTGTAFEHSYLFAGIHGSGKTTLGRILARAMLCSDLSPEGDPCDKCASCRDILESGQSETFMEVDAATNSGKEEIRKIKEDLMYSTFSGKKRLYLFDESHALSLQALDGLLKPMEECLPNSRDRKMVCIFCTTEPEKMRNTVLSRCAPAFIIETLEPKLIAERLAYICKEEGMEFDSEVLPLIAEMKESHIRDAIKAIEGISRLGAINRENTSKYLHLDLNSVFLDLAEAIQSDPTVAASCLKTLNNRISPVSCYEKLCKLFMAAYKSQLGVNAIPIYWDRIRVEKLGEQFGRHLIDFVSFLSARPGRPSLSTLECDVFQLSKIVGGMSLDAGIPIVVQQVVSGNSESKIVPPQNDVKKKNEKSLQEGGKVRASHGVTVGGVFVDKRAVKGNSKVSAAAESHQSGLELSQFSALLELRVKELLGVDSSGRHQGRPDLGGIGVDPDGGKQG
jgi:DNA polymerase III subunit gamma/tau